jgi:hypothetical protein
MATTLTIAAATLASEERTMPDSYYYMVKCNDLGIRKLCHNINEVLDLLDNWTDDWQEKFEFEKVTRTPMSLSDFK